MSIELTTAALAEKKRQGVKLGPARALPAEVEEWIRKERADGASLKAIKSDLEANNIKTPRGQTEWHLSTIDQIAKRGHEVPLGAEQAAKRKAKKELQNA